jgi:hypothetical protein
VTTAVGTVATSKGVLPGVGVAPSTVIGVSLGTDVNVEGGRGVSVAPGTLVSVPLGTAVKVEFSAGVLVGVILGTGLGVEVKIARHVPWAVRKTEGKRFVS